MRDEPRFIAIAGRTFLTAAALVGGVWVLERIWTAVMVLAVALVLLGTFNPLVRWLERHGWRRRWVVAVICVAGLLAAAGLILATIPALWSQIAALVKNLPGLQTRAASFAESFSLTKDLGPKIRDLQLGELAVANVPSRALSASSGVMMAIGYAATTLVLGIYFLADPSGPRMLIFALVPRAHHDRLARILSELEVIVGGYVRGQVITSVLIWMFTLVLLTALRVHNALALAVFAALADVLPFVGGLLAIVPSALTALTRGPWTAVAVVVALTLYEEVESRFIVPRVYGRALRLSPAAVILALLIGGQLMGVMGAFLALPVAAAIRMLITELQVPFPGGLPDSGQ